MMHFDGKVNIIFIIFEIISTFAGDNETQTIKLVLKIWNLRK